jgi:exo-rhamnogalacturonan lyase-like protein
VRISFVVTVLVVIVLFVFGHATVTLGAIDVTLTVKESAGVDVSAFNGYPVTFVVPLPYGVYQNTSTFSVRDSSGTAVPAQFAVLNRWWGRDGSIRNLQVHFQPLVGKYDPNDLTHYPGISTYHLKDDSGNVAPSTAVSVTDSGNKITVATGSVTFKIKKTGFNIFDYIGRDTNTDGNIDPNDIPAILSSTTNGARFVDRNGNVLRDADLSPNNVTIEESGPLRAVLRVDTQSQFLAANQSGTNLEHRFGRAVRLYAYAGKPYIQIDYQLQNSSLDDVWSWPMYFDSFTLDFHLNAQSTPTIKYGTSGGGVVTAPSQNTYLAQEHHSDHYYASGGAYVPLPGYTFYNVSNGTTFGHGAQADGWIDVNDGTNGVQVTTRWFWQTWPNGLRFNGADSNLLSVELFPAWSSQWMATPSDTTPHLHSSGWYWLEDMQQVYKSVLFMVHAPSMPDTTLAAVDNVFNHPPIVALPLSWYQQTRATLDLDGYVPEAITDPGTRVENYSSSQYFNPTIDGSYIFNVVNFRDDPSRKASNWTGQWPASNSAFYGSGSPSHWFDAEQLGVGELNVRPEWLPHYTYDSNWATLQLQHTLGKGSWRQEPGPLANTEHKMIANYWPDSGAGESTGRQGVTKQQNWYAKDAQHAWFYHIEESYYTVPNPWIKDWYTFQYEFWKKYLIQDQITGTTPTRGMAHTLASALQAYRVTGDPTGDTSLLSLGKNWIGRVHTAQSPLYGTHRSSETGFEVGFLCRALFAFMKEVDGQDPQAWSDAFNVASGYMEWNLAWGNFGSATAPTPSYSRGQGSSGIDPQALYYWKTGKIAYWNQIQDYLGVSDGQPGIGVGGEAPEGAGDFLCCWTGDWHGRAYRYVLNTTRSDTTPPAKITNVSAARIAGNKVRLTWTAPTASDLARYHIVWTYGHTIKEATLPVDTSGNTVMWWAANTFGQVGFVPLSGQTQSCDIPVDPSQSFYAAVFTFDSSENMSVMSNVANVP